MSKSKKPKKIRFKKSKLTKPSASVSKMSEERFHATRRMFGLIGEEFHVSREGDTRGHRQWFLEEGWVSAEADYRTQDIQFNNIPRGFILGEKIYTYKAGFESISGLENEIIVSQLLESELITENMNLFSGVIPGTVGEEWTPRVHLGTVAQFMS